MVDAGLIVLDTLSFILLFIFATWTIFASSIFLRKNKAKDFRPVGVSVVVPAYNEESKIATCLKAIFSSNYPREKIEVIVVDDGSSDKTVEVAKKFGARIFKLRHGGKVEALNLGISKARNEYVVTVDADTVVQKDALVELVKEISSDAKIGSVSGIVKPINTNSITSIFQSVEYLYLYFIKKSFSSFFGSSPGICGALACYRKNVLTKIGGFPKRTFSEDFDISLLIKKANYSVVFANKAMGETFVPASLGTLIEQRMRWGQGVLQSIENNLDIFSKKGNDIGSRYFIAVQMFWYIYPLLAMPLIAFQFFYWLPYNSQTFADTTFYLVRWASILGPLYVLYMIQQWGLNPSLLLQISGVFFTVPFMIVSTFYFNDKLNWKKVLAIVFYFPYIILLNFVNVVSMLFFIFDRSRKHYFIKPK